MKMLSRLKVMMMLFAVLVIGASWSPCCCQSDWVVREGARLLAGGAGIESGCECCRAEQGRQGHEHGCPLGEQDCTPSIVKTTPTAPVQAAPPAPTAWAWVEWLDPPHRVVGIATQAVEDRAHTSVDVTLLGLGCALVV